MRAMNRRDYRVEQEQRRRRGEMKKVRRVEIEREKRRSGRKTEQKRAVQFEVTKVCFKLSCAFSINHSACDKLCFSLNHFENKEVAQRRLKAREVCSK